MTMQEYEGPSAAKLEVQALLGPLLRNVPRRKVKVYKPSTGEVVGEVTLAEALEGVLKANDLQNQVDEETRPKTVKCEYCGLPVKVALSGSVLRVCREGCRCDCGNRMSRSRVMDKVRLGQKGECKNCTSSKNARVAHEASRQAFANRSPEQRTEMARKNGEAVRQALANMSPEQRLDRIKKARDATPEQLSERARKGYETRRAKKQEQEQAA